MPDDHDPAIIGRRSSDGGYLSLREAVKMFATKEELSSMKLGIDALVLQVGRFVTRAEHEARWDRDDEFRRETKEALNEARAQRVPQWLLMALGPLVAIGLALWHH